MQSKRIRTNVLVRAAAGAVVAAAVCGCETLKLPDTALSLFRANATELPLDTIVAGLKDALGTGAGNAVAQLSRPGAYTNDAALRIPLPPQLEKAAEALRTVGLGPLVETFEKKMNAGAEQAAAQALPLFKNAIGQMTFTDAKRILTGGGTAATDYFRQKLGDDLEAAYAPVIRNQLSTVGAVRAYEAVVAAYTKLPFAQKPALALEDYAAERAVAGLFAVVAQEERKIRQDPAARTTELLRTVFGAAR